MVGFRVFDVGLLIVWLVWFFRLRDDEDDAAEEGGGDGGGGSPKPKPPRSGPGPGGLRLPLGRWPNGGHLRGGRSPARTPLQAPPGARVAGSAAGPRALSGRAQPRPAPCPAAA